MVVVPPVIAVETELISAPPGSSVELECESEAHPKSIDYWEHNNQMIISDNNYRVSNIRNSYR